MYQSDSKGTEMDKYTRTTMTKKIIMMEYLSTIQVPVFKAMKK